MIYDLITIHDALFYIFSSVGITAGVVVWMQRRTFLRQELYVVIWLHPRTGAEGRWLWGLNRCAKEVFKHVYLAPNTHRVVIRRMTRREIDMHCFY